MGKSIKSKLLVLMSLLVLLPAASMLLPREAAVSAAPKKVTHPVLLFISDGMRHDLMLDYIDEGIMPTYRKLLQRGVQGQNGMIPNVPANTGPSWTAMMTGAPAAVTSVTNNTYHNNNNPFSSWGTSAWGTGVNQAETLAEKADAEGLKVAVLGWQAFDSSLVPNGSVVEYYPDWLTGRGVVANYPLNLEWSAAVPTSPVLANNQVVLQDATGWTNAPASFSQPKETSFAINDWSYMPALTLQVYVFDSTNDGVVNYDKVLVSTSKDATQAVATLAQGEWSGSIPATVFDWMGVPNEGGYYLKAIDLTPDLSKFRLFHSQVTRIRAVPQALEDDLATRFGAVMPMDFSPYIAGLIDVDTFVEGHTMSTELLGTEIYPYVMKTQKPDLVLSGVEWTDMNQHRFLGRCLPGSDVYNPATAEEFCGYLKGSYATSDKVLKAMWKEMPNATVIATSDHGFSVTSKAISATYVLSQAGLFTPGNFTTSKAIAYGAGGTLQVYINLEGRNPGGVVPAHEYEAVRQQVVDAFAALGPTMIEQIVLKEDTAAIQTTLGQTYNMLNQDTTGDVVIFSAPPFQFDAAAPFSLTNDAPIYGQHGFLPNGDPDRFAAFLVAGPKIKKSNQGPVVNAIDIAPTIAHALGISAPANSQGLVLNIFKK